MEGENVVYCIFAWFVFGLVGMLIGKRKGAEASGCFLGVILGPIGWIIALLMQGSQKKCPRCGEMIRSEATVCRFCHTDVTAVRSQNTAEPALKYLLRGSLYFVLLFLLLVVGLGFYERYQKLAADDKALAEQAIAERASNLSKPDATPIPGTPAPAAFVQDVKYSQHAAVQKYPDLGIAGSPLNVRFLARLKQWQASTDPHLNRSNWPEKLADEVAAKP